MSTSLLESLVQISSGSMDPDGVRAVQEVAAERLRSIGGAIQWIAPEVSGAIKPPHGAELLVARWGKPPYVTFVTHADTVFEKNSDFRGMVWNADRTWVTGPGVIDDKGGIVVALTGLQAFLEKHPKLQANVQWICAPTEELGSPGFGQVFQQLSAESSCVLGFEPALDDGSMITHRQGNRWYNIHVQGREAHAGRDHKRGINAAHELCIKLDRIQKLTSYPKKITANIGSITAGTGKYNIVCGQAEGRVDVRFPSFAAMEKVDRAIAGILKKTFVKGARTKWVLTDDCPPLEMSAQGRALAAQVVSLARQMGQRTPKLAASGGSSDCNYLSRPGLPIVDGFGPIGRGLHTTQESLFVASLKSKADLLASTLEVLFSLRGNRKSR